MLLPLAILAGCTATSDDPGAAPPSPQVSLPQENPAPGDHETAFLDSSGKVRSYLVHAPPGYSSGKSYPLVLVFHGSPGEPEEMPERTKMNDVADKNGFLVVYPDHVFDVKAIDELIEHLTARWGVDPKRVHAAGFSRGATFTYKLAIELTSRFGSVAPVSGSSIGNEQLSQPISLITFQGGRDRLSQAFTVTNNDWAEAATCADEQLATITMEGGPAHVRTSTCKGGAEHVIYSVARMGHEWPADASRLIWAFFTKHPLP